MNIERRKEVFVEKASPNARMLNLLKAIHHLDFRVADPQAMIDKSAERVEIDIDILVDRGSQYGSGMAKIIGWVISPSAKKTNP